MATKKAAKKKAPPKFAGEVMARAAADYADMKKAEDIVILDVRDISTVTDYLVICSVSSMPQLRAVRDEVWDKFNEEHKIKPIASDTNLASLWIILHYGDVMVHVFLKDRRDFYALEELWSDAPRVEWAPPAPPKKRAARRVAKKK